MKNFGCGLILGSCIVGIAGIGIAIGGLSGLFITVSLVGMLAGFSIVRAKEQ
jgi:hypothetical protein